MKDFTIDIGHPIAVATILDNELWVFENFNREMVNTITHPVKFSANTSIFVKKGKCIADINLISHQIEAPCFVNIRESQILRLTELSENLEASCMVISNSISKRIFSYFSSTPYSTLLRRYPVVQIPEELTVNFSSIYSICDRIAHNTENPHIQDCLIHTLMAFFYETAYRCYDPLKNAFPTSPGRLTDRFITLVQENFKKERFLDFYASKLEITSKHLSRSIKQQTGYTAVEWIDKFIVLEAEALLKSSNLNIQQIADELNFPSQSFFGKYFKKHTGLSPKEFRNQ